MCKLLVALVRNVGFPSDLHSEIRNCIGGTTYVLFIIDYVLRRAIVKDNVRDTSSKEIEALYFATPADKARVIAHALAQNPFINYSRYTPLQVFPQRKPVH